MGHRRFGTVLHRTWTKKGPARNQSGRGLDAVATASDGLDVVADPPVDHVLGIF
jgi:hypothetical protein